MSTEDRELTNHEYDGIKEYDNPLPNWWLVTFFGTIIFAFIYWVHYEISGAPNLDQELATAMQKIESHQAAAPKAQISDAEFANLEKDTGRMQAAHSNFVAKCAACHGQKLEGLIGPNLTDNFWINGSGSYKDLAKVIREGVPAKGMPPWEALLKESEVAELVAYIHAQKGSNPPNGKAPEGHEVK